MPSFPFRNKTLAVAVKRHARVETKLFLSSPVLLGFYILLQIFFPNKHLAHDCLSKQIFGFSLAQSSSNFNFLTLSIFPKHFSNL